MQKKLIKMLATSLVMVFLLGTTVPVYGETVRETEPNGTRETAETILANTQTPEEYVDADNSNIFVVKGTVSSNDIDWFKVYLSSQDKYFSISSDLLYYQIFDSNGAPVTELIYETEATSNYHVYDYSDLSTGYYYICLTSEKASSSYQFLFGNPVYRISKIVKEGSRVSLSSTNNSDEDTIDFEIGECPNESQVFTYTYGSSARTFTPSYSFYYVYPLLP